MRQVAEFYETSVYAVRMTYQRHRKEIDVDGVKIMASKDFLHLTQNVLDVKRRDNTGYFIPFGNSEIVIPNGKQTYFPPRAVLRIGMLLLDSEVAKEVRTQTPPKQLHNNPFNLQYTLLKSTFLRPRIVSNLIALCFSSQLFDAILAPSDASNPRIQAYKYDSHHIKNHAKKT